MQKSKDSLKACFENVDIALERDCIVPSVNIHLVLGLSGYLLPYAMFVSSEGFYKSAWMHKHVPAIPDHLSDKYQYLAC